MAVTPPAICPFTGYSIQPSVTDDYYEYSLSVNKNPYVIRLAKINWADPNFFNPNTKWIFHGMLYNKEWPIERETIITPFLLTQIIRLGEYPHDKDDQTNNFNKKIDYFILKCYIRGGFKYQKLYFNLDEYPMSYSENETEFKGIERALLSKKYVNPVNDTNHIIIELTEEGMNVAKDIYEADIMNEKKTQVRRL